MIGRGNLNSVLSWPTRRKWLVSPWFKWTQGTLAGLVPSAGIARKPIVREGRFLCKNCGHADHADRNVALDIRALANRELAIELGSHPIRRMVEPESSPL